jgi:myo-inositol-1(or 4)-monophosphatase
VAGGIFNPQTDELLVGSIETGVTYNGRPVRVKEPAGEGARAVVLASRSELGRGEWDSVQADWLEVRACGSVAYKMGLVAAGHADATWTLVPKSEWDVAAGTALVRAAGGIVSLVDGSDPLFNKPDPVFPNFVAAGQAVARRLLNELQRRG